MAEKRWTLRRIRGLGWKYTVSYDNSTLSCIERWWVRAVIGLAGDLWITRPHRGES